MSPDENNITESSDIEMTPLDVAEAEGTEATFDDTETVSTESPRRADSIKIATKQEIIECMKKSKHLQSKVQSAKTTTKKKFYQKKLKKHNRHTIQLLSALDKMQK